MRVDFSKTETGQKTTRPNHLKLGSGQRRPLLGDQRPQQLVSPSKSSLCTGHKEGALVFVEVTALASAETAN